jgi:hypothetical protein
MPMAPGLAATACASLGNLPLLLKCESMIKPFIKPKPVVIVNSPFKCALVALP